MADCRLDLIGPVLDPGFALDRCYAFHQCSEFDFDGGRIKLSRGRKRQYDRGLGLEP